MFISFSSYFRSIDEHHQGPCQYITSVFYHKDSNRQMLWSRNLLMPYHLARFNWYQDSQQDCRSGGIKNILDVFEIDTKANFLETLSGKSIISKKGGALCLPPTIVKGSGNAERNALFCLFFIQNSVKRLKWSFFYLKWNFL